MTGKKINIDQLSMEIADIFDNYKDLTLEQVKSAVTKTAKETAKKINQNAAATFGGDKYKKSWRYKRDPDLKGRWKYSMVVYSSNGGYRIAHLLEKGHAKRNGGRVEGRPHIAPAADEAKDILIDAIYQEME